MGTIVEMKIEYGHAELLSAEHGEVVRTEPEAEEPD
jgi:hypothetical protein